jgi:carboxylesterase type B
LYSRGRGTWLFVNVAEVFNDLFWDVLFKTNADERLASLMSEFWFAFGKTADPNFKGASIRWPQWKGRRRWVTRARAAVCTVAYLLDYRKV